MIKTVMFDLDGTLLPMDLEEFIKCYFSLLGQKMNENGYDGKSLNDCLLKATMKVTQNDGSKTNEEVFWDSFSSLMNIEKDDIYPMLEDFYNNDFQAIEKQVKKSIDMIEIVNILKEKGYQLVCATNPLFPFMASESRLKWSGVDTSAFDYISTYEDFHYCKPNVKYYEEVFEKWSIKPKECIMIGNDALEDGVIEELGIDCYLVEDYLINRSNSEINVKWHGKANELVNVVKKFKDLKKAE